MNDKQIVSVLTYLAEASKNKQLNWEHDIEGDFRLTFPKSSIGLEKSNTGVYIKFYNDQGIAILTVGPHNVMRFGLAPDVLDFIYRQAENQIYRHDETIEDILSNLTQPRSKR
jgi:hypothetical protein